MAFILFYWLPLRLRDVLVSALKYTSVKVQRALELFCASDTSRLLRTITILHQNSDQISFLSFWRGWESRRKREYRMKRCLEIFNLRPSVKLKRGSETRLVRLRMVASRLYRHWPGLPKKLSKLARKTSKLAQCGTRHHDKSKYSFRIPQKEKRFRINYSILLRSNVLTVKQIILMLTNIEVESHFFIPRHHHYRHQTLLLQRWLR